MADNTTLNAGSGGDVIRDEDIGGVKFPVSKVVLGPPNVDHGDVSETNPLPVTSDARVQKRFDIGTATIYVGFAAVGVATDATGWTIKKITLVGGSPTSVQWTGRQTAKWDNRAAESYS